MRQIHKAFTITYFFFFASVFFGPAFFSYSLGPIAIFPARIILFPLWVLFCIGVYTKAISTAPFKHKTTRIIFLFLAGWLVYGLLSLGWALIKIEGIRDLLNMTVGFSTFALAPFLDKKCLSTLVKIWAGMFVASLFIGIIEHVTTLHLPISRLNDPALSHVNFRPSGFFDNENNYASFLTLSLPLALYAFRNNKATIKKLLWGSSIFFSVYLILVTTSRLNYLIMCIVFVVFALVLTQKKQRLKTLTALILLVVATTAFMGTYQPALRGIVDNRLSSLYEAMEDFIDNLAPNNPENPYMVRETSIATRINMVKNGLYFTAQTWGRGVGAGNFEQWIEQRAKYSTNNYVNPHNWWIELLAEYGVIIFLGYLIMWASMTWTLSKAIWKTTTHTQVGTAFLALLVLPLVALSPSTFLTYNPHWLTLGLALATLYHHRKEANEDASAPLIPSLSLPQ
jgi:teichuronic acid biosynthesis protein TuaE